MVILIIGLLASVLILLFSYLWVDFAIPLMLAPAKPWVTVFINLYDWANTHRVLNFWFYFIIIFILFVCQYAVWRYGQKIIKYRYLWPGLVLISLISSLSYPFLSRDIFSYLFGAKMVWSYHVNPYTVLPGIFVNTDLWLRFTHWVDKTYVYGPVYLVFSLLPLIIWGGDRFLLNFWTLKIISAAVFCFGGWLWWQMTTEKKTVLIWWFFNPLLIIEWLVNGHNDLIMVVLFILAVYLEKQKHYFGTIWAFLASVLTKYISIGLIFSFFLRGKYQLWFYKIMAVSLLFYLGLKNGQLWYYTWLMMFLPFAEFKPRSLIGVNLFFGIMLVTRYGGWIFYNRWENLPFLPNLSWLLILFPLLFGLSELLPFPKSKNSPPNYLSK